MGFLKKLGYGLLAILIAIFVFVLLCALNPSLTESISGILYGTDGEGGLVGNAAENEAGPDVHRDLPGGVQIQPSADADQASLVPYTPYNGTITTIPDNVLGRSGYIPVEGTGEELSETQAREVRDSIDKGSDGNGLEFDPYIYPYYAMLDSTTQALYRQIFANARDVVVSFAPCVEANTDQVQYAFEAVFGDHPELFYVQTAYTEKYTSDKKVVEIDLSFYTIVNDLENARAAFESAAGSIEEAARQYSDDYSRERYVHDYLISTVQYDETAPMDQSAYSALVLGRSVCAGYARGFQYVMQRLGIPAYYCAGTSGEDHAWNIVKLGDGYYNVDVTWDDSEPASYDYFNKSDGDYAGTHVRKSLSVYLPACMGTQYRNLESGEPSGDGLGELPEEREGYDPYFDPFINNDPVAPLDYESEHPELTEDEDNSSSPSSGTGTATTPSSNAAAQLAVHGLTESDALPSLEDYYRDCRIQLVSCGMGDHCFYNVVPESLFRTIESEYGKGNYLTGYMESALKTIGATNCNIVIQAERLGGGYYRIWHNVYVW
ncbi:MAG: hypothetical protein K5871_10155 [Lachnospiraceae bacterium]|nr:hypothetical protein [Lachnospiraceae bacterium]